MAFGPPLSKHSLVRPPAEPFFRPDPRLRLPRAAAVKDGRFMRPPAGLVLDGREHGGRLMWVGVLRHAGIASLPAVGDGASSVPGTDPESRFGRGPGSSLAKRPPQAAWA
jgi:hypothetical protein